MEFLRIQIPHRSLAEISIGVRVFEFVVDVDGASTARIERQSVQARRTGLTIRVFVLPKGQTVLLNECAQFSTDGDAACIRVSRARSSQNSSPTGIDRAIGISVIGDYAYESGGKRVDRDCFSKCERGCLRRRFARHEPYR